MPFTCDYCGFKVKSKRGLRQHIDGKPLCLAKERKKSEMLVESYNLSRKASTTGSIPSQMQGVSTPGLLKKAPPVASMPNKNIGDSDSEEDNRPREKYPRPNGRKRQQSRRVFDQSSKRQRQSEAAYSKEKANVLGLSAKNVRLLEKYAAMEKSRTMEEVNVDEEVKSSDDADEPQGTYDWNDSSESELEFVVPQEGPLGTVDGRGVAPGEPQNIDHQVLEPDYNNDRNINIQPNTEMRENFKEYCCRGSTFLPTFTKVQARSVRLMARLKNKGAPLGTYDAIMEWHHRENGDINSRETLQHVANADDYISRKQLLKFLTTRYNMTDKIPKNLTVKLPNSKAKVTLTVHNAWHCIESLLTDPRLNDEDYNFHNNDPFAPPPPLGKISDLHTGNAYYRAYQQFIKKPGQVLLPFTMYIDGAVTGQFQNLPITALKIALGIHTRKHRDKDLAWRTLGYVAQISKAASRGKHIFHQSKHLDSELVYLSDDEGGEDVTKDVCKAQDFHTMLDAILGTFVEVQNNGFMWDLRYMGKTYTDVEFVPFVIFIKCDTDEADLLCGSYKSRGAGVAQLCRYCTCPTLESDNVLATYPVKSVELIQKLVENEDFEGLKKLSQQMIQNAWYKIRFHPATIQGIHGACPSEMLHALLLGVFKYIRECFFEQIGPTSALADEINALAQQYGDAFARQSERDMPKCKFKHGIKKGKLMAKEFRGILLVIGAVLRSALGRQMLQKNKNFKEKNVIEDWVLLVEMVLEWEAYLNEHEMEARHVVRLGRKNRFIMSLIKRVAKRSAGMGLKLMKFHVIIHMMLDIHLYGVPLEVDTGSNESQHKKAKVAARLTQKNEATFDFQTCIRLNEFFLYDLAVAELEEERQMWKYYEKPADPPPEDPPDHPPPRTGGERMWVYQDDKYGDGPVYSMGTGPQSREPCQLEWDNELVPFLFELQQKLGVEKLEIRGQHTREGVIFRGHPNYREKPWRDWATIDWGVDAQLPGQIWCFVVIDSIEEEDDPIHHGAIEVENGTYAVIECAYPDERIREKQKSDLFLPINKQVAQTANDERGWRRKFWLADVEAITGPLVVVPNIGGDIGVEYLIVRQRREWVGIFKDWLDESHEYDVIDDAEQAPAQVVNRIR